MTPDLTVLILTFNETRHIERCIKSVSSIAKRIVVVDSFSKDGTCSIAEAHGAEVLQNPWSTHANQFNWALDNASISTGWVMRIDADEVVEDNLSAWIERELKSLAPSIHGITIRRRIYFLGRWIRHGSIYPKKILRIWRTGTGRCEDKLMDEHIAVSGSVIDADGDISDINLNNLSWWIEKHNRYSTLEALEALKAQQSDEHFDVSSAALAGQARIIRLIKTHIYSRLPTGLRSLLYFCYRYFIRLGLLDGWPGLAFHFLQGFWYRFLVDAKILEISQQMRTRALSLGSVAKLDYGITITSQPRD